MTYFVVFGMFVVLGVFVTVLLLCGRTSTKEELMEQADEEFARKMGDLARRNECSSSKRKDLWKEIGGFRGLFYLVRQALLWTKIVNELGKEIPSLLTVETCDMEAKANAMRFLILRCLIPKWRHLNGCLCVHLFSQVFAIAEGAIVRYDALRKVANHVV